VIKGSLKMTVWMNIQFQPVMKRGIKMMKRFLIITLIAVFSIGGLALNSFGEEKPIYGGILKGIRQSFPKVLGYPPEMSPTDSIAALPYAERLTNWDAKGNMVPELAESWEEDRDKLTITFHLRKGVRFSDGTPFNAEAVKWNWRMRLDKTRLPYGKYVKKFEVLDDHTIRVHVTAFNNQLAFNYGWQQQYSPTAFYTHGLDWVRKHGIGTGPFKLAEFKRDTIIKYEKNDDYWRKGYPYLDGIEVRFIPDSMTAAAMLEAGEADVWIDVRYVQNILDFEKKGYKINWGPGFFWALLPNSRDASSKFSNPKVREALEHAIDRPAVARMLGHGKYEPLSQMAPSDWPGHVPGYDPRPYNPEKAKALLAEAGYPNGFKTTILAYAATGQEPGAAVQAFLAAVGIDAKLDLADPGRFYGSVFGRGWSDLALAVSGINPDATDIFVHYGPDPMTFRTGNIKKSAEYLALAEDALHTYDMAGMVEKIKKVVVQGGEDAMVVPLFVSAQANVMQSYVHSKYMLIHSVYWQPYDSWMEKH
jgi:peptide/nickel transport system substrate-binding protein